MIAAEGVSLCIVDDDPSVRSSLTRLLRAEGIEPMAFATAEDFLEHLPNLPGPCCALLDIGLPGKSGLELHARITAVRPAAAEKATKRDLALHYGSLTPREREVLTHVIAGKRNKVIAAEIGTTEKTVKVHRGRIMEKMKVRSVAELVRAADRLGIRPTPSPPRGKPS